MALTLNNNLSTLKVGDYFWCRYRAPKSGQVGSISDVATKTDAEAIPVIPVSSSATPDGYFRFIMVEDWNGKKRLIADRNIQHSINWDSLHVNGIASGSGISINQSKNANSYISSVTASETWFNASFNGEKSIDNNPATNSALSANNKTKWEYRYSFNIPIQVSILSLHSFFISGYEPIGDFNVYGANLADFSDRKFLGSYTHSNVDNSIEYVLGATEKFNHIILEITSVSAGNGGNNIMIKEIGFYDDSLVNEDNVQTIRLLTGGISAADSDNEWNKYIIASTLDGNIVPGDNNVWNWDGLASWTSTTHISGATHRTIRGKYVFSGSTYDRQTSAGPSGNITSSAVNIIGFRPILEIKILRVDKILILSQNSAYSHNGLVWENKGIVPIGENEKKIFYEENGMDEVVKEQLETLGSSLPDGKGKIGIMRI